MIDWHDPAIATALPAEIAISAITAAELSAGPLLAGDAIEAARRQTRLQEVETLLEPIASTRRPHAATGLSSPLWSTNDEGRVADSPIY